MPKNMERLIIDIQSFSYFSNNTINNLVKATATAKRQNTRTHPLGSLELSTIGLYLINIDFSRILRISRMVRLITMRIQRHPTFAVNGTMNGTGSIRRMPMLHFLIR